MKPTHILPERSAYDGYPCNLCGGPGALPTTEHQDDAPGFTLYDQPCVCGGCDRRWSESTREFRHRVRQGLGTEPPDGVTDDCMFDDLPGDAA